MHSTSNSVDLDLWVPGHRLLRLWWWWGASVSLRERTYESASQSCSATGLSHSKLNIGPHWFIKSAKGRMINCIMIWNQTNDRALSMEVDKSCGIVILLLFGPANSRSCTVSYFISSTWLLWVRMSWPSCSSISEYSLMTSCPRIRQWR